ncbi:uncharacterized protein LOC135825988 [Sycon ciliatum]|uniref:uncharacterized protein LOC135825988 n=1 Tax=Sycon ciliatum TaxID=27933 RepID=UPI0031F62534
MARKGDTAAERTAALQLFGIVLMLSMSALGASLSEPETDRWPLCLGDPANENIHYYMKYIIAEKYDPHSDSPCTKLGGTPADLTSPSKLECARKAFPLKDFVCLEGDGERSSLCAAYVSKDYKLPSKVENDNEIQPSCKCFSPWRNITSCDCRLQRYVVCELPAEQEYYHPLSSSEPGPSTKTALSSRPSVPTDLRFATTMADRSEDTAPEDRPAVVQEISEANLSWGAPVFRGDSNPASKSNTAGVYDEELQRHMTWVLPTVIASLALLVAIILVLGTVLWRSTSRASATLNTQDVERKQTPSPAGAAAKQPVVKIGNGASSANNPPRQTSDTSMHSTHTEEVACEIPGQALENPMYEQIPIPIQIKASVPVYLCPADERMYANSSPSTSATKAAPEPPPHNSRPPL